MTAFLLAITGSMLLFLADWYETRPERRYRMEQFAVAIWTSVRGLIRAARLVVGR